MTKFQSVSHTELLFGFKDLEYSALLHFEASFFFEAQELQSPGCQTVPQHIF